MKKITVKIDLGKYKYVDLELSEAQKLLNEIANRRGETRDLLEALRYLKNFDEFYMYMKKKFKDFITPPKEPKDLVSGRVVVDKLKLYTRDDVKRVVIVFDRRVDIEFLQQLLKTIGYDDIVIRKEVF